MHDGIGDHRFRQLYRDHQRSILAYFLRRTDQESAFDAASETFLVAWRRIEDVPEGDGTLPWLYGVASNVLANLRRSQRRAKSLDEKLRSTSDVVDGVTPESVMVRRAEDEETIAALSRLRPADQEIIQLSVWEELPNATIADMLDTSPHAVSQRIHRITRGLAHDLASQEQRMAAAPHSAGRGGHT